MGPLDLANYVQQQGEMGRERGTNTRLNQLAGQAYGANPQDQRGLVQQAIQTDRGQGMALGKSLGADHQERTNRAAQKVGMFVKVYKANPQMAGGMYPGIAQEVGQLFPEMQIPQEFSPEFLPGLEQFAASMGGGESGDDLKSLRIGANGNYWAIRGGQFVDTGTAAAPTNQIMDTGNGVVGIDKRTLQSSPVQMGGQGVPQPGQPRAPGEVPFSVDPSLPPEVQAAIRANEPQWAQASDQSQMQIPQQGQPQGGQLRTTPKPQAPPKGYMPDGMGGLRAIPGGPAQMALDARAEALAAKKNAADVKAAGKAKEDAARQAEATNATDQLISAIDDLTGHAGFGDLGTAWGDTKINTPLVRNDAKDAHAQLQNIGGQVALSTMARLKALSSSGATGFGALSAPELKLLENAISSLQSDQISNAQLKANLKVIRDTLEKTKNWKPPQQPASPANDDDEALIGKYL